MDQGTSPLPLEAKRKGLQEEMAGRGNSVSFAEAGAIVQPKT